MRMNDGRLIAYDAWDGWQDPRFAPAHFYQTREWFDVLAGTWTDLEIKILPLTDTLVIPLFIQRRGPLQLLGSPLRGFFTPYGGPLGQGQAGNIRKALHADFCELAYPPAASAPPDWSQLKTIHVDLAGGIDAVWANMDSATRRQIKQGEGRGAVIRDEVGVDWIKPFRSLVVQTYSRQGLPPPAPLAFYENIARHLLPGKAKVLMVYAEGVPVAGTIWGRDGKTVYGIDRGADANYSHLRPANLMDWTLIQWAVKEGLKTYDMVGGNIPGIARYKLGFGGRELSYPAVTWTPTLLGTIAWRGYALIKSPLKKVRSLREPKP